MPDLSLSKLLKRLGEKPPSCVVFLHGSEEYLKEQALARVLETAVDPATRDFNLDQLRGGDATADGLASLLATPPMMADRRVVVLREGEGLNAKARETVERVAERPYLGLYLIITATIPSGSKAKFYDTIRGSSLSVEFAGVDPVDLPGWIIEHGASEHSIQIDVDAARALAAAIGAELGVLAAEIEKAVAYVGDRSRIALEDIKAVGGYIPQTNRWQWLDLVGEKKFLTALQQVPELIDGGENAVGLVIALGTHFLRLGILVDGGREGLDRHLKSQKWLVNKLQPQARKWTLPEIDSALADLLRADRLLKSAAPGDREAIEELLLRLAERSKAFEPRPRPRPLGTAASNR